MGVWMRKKACNMISLLEFLCIFPFGQIRCPHRNTYELVYIFQGQCCYVRINEIMYITLKKYRVKWNLMALMASLGDIIIRFFSRKKLKKFLLSGELHFVSETMAASKPCATSQVTFTLCVLVASLLLLGHFDGQGQPSETVLALERQGCHPDTTVPCV